ncbi:hypothetical protein PoB_004163100 [Plakobranchus ocellatus]|uniref:Uncharacterized protein n=1 Tax=Plakobranchus ocellatus TaxID=259542 RepID=A0AAV4B3U8_9GAST|nr:hypothetical protein PoB_004163100 [Plakobranchus ocellatus]
MLQVHEIWSWSVDQAKKIARRGNKTVCLEKIKGIADSTILEKNINLKPKSLRRYVISVAYDSITEAHLGIRRRKDNVLSYFKWMVI